MPLALKTIMYLLFDSSSIVTVILKVLYIIGVWKVLEKSGIKGWLALIPWVRNYQLSRCAMREPEGRVWCVNAFFMTITNLVLALNSTGTDAAAAPGAGAFPLNLPGTAAALLLILSIVLPLVELIYGARVYAGLSSIYGVRKLWVLLWLTPAACIPALLWGFKENYKPSLQAEDIKAEMARLATHGSVAVMDEGLTVNLQERSVHEFLHKKVLLRDIHLSIPQGHMVLLLGGSGAGKSTFVNAVNGYEKAKAEVMLNGSNIYTQYDKVKYDIGFVPQGDMMRGKDTVINTLQDASLLRLPMDVDARQRRTRVDEVMGIFGLAPVQNSQVEKLSGGQRKRLSIGMEFISNPSLFILDEPDSGLDGVMARELFTQLRKIADTGKIVIAISHTPDRVIDLFDDVIVLAKDSTRTGRLAFYGSVEEARKFFGKERMEDIVKAVNQKEEGGEGLADELVMRFAEVQHA